MGYITIFTERISIHALREEGDSTPVRRGLTATYFYPRPPRGGRRRTLESVRSSSRFLSTPSARRATLLQLGDVHLIAISIHALREEGDVSVPV